MSNLAMVAFQPHPAVHPGALVPDPASSPLHRDPTIIGCGACAIMGAQHEAALHVTPEISARAQYRIDGARIRGTVFLRVGGHVREIPFDVDGTPIVRRLAALFVQSKNNTIGWPRINLRGIFRTITAPIRAVVETAKATVASVKQVAKGLPPTAAFALIKRAIANGRAQIRIAKNVWSKAGAFVAKAAKNQLVKGLKAVIKSPITKGILTGVAIAFPAVGAPALAAVTAAHAAIAAVENAQAAANALKGAADTAAKLANMVKTAATPAKKQAAARELAKVKQVIAVSTPKVAELKKHAAIASSGLKQLAAEAKRGDRSALLSLRVAKGVQTTHAKMRAIALAAALRTHQPKTPAERARVVADALRRYVPVAATDLGRYHPRYRALMATAAKATAKPVAKPVARPGTKPAAKPAARPAARPAAAKPAARRV